MAARGKGGVVLLTFRTSGTQKAADDAKKLGDNVDQVGSKVGKSAQGLGTFAGGLDEIIGGLLPFDIGLGRMAGGLDDFGGKLDKSENKTKQWSAGLAVAAGAAAAGFTAAMADGIGQNIELGNATSTISAQLGLTEAESARIGEVAGGLYADAYGDSIEGVADVVGDVVSSIDGMRDASADALEDMTKNALNFSTAFEIDTGRATQVVGQMLTTGLAKDADEAFDLLSKTMQSVPKNVREDVLDAVDEYGPFFSQLGLDGAAAFGLLAKGAEDGMYGIDKTGDALKEFTIRATDGSKATREAFADAGVFGKDGEVWLGLEAGLLKGGDDAKAAFDKIVGGLLEIKDPAAQSTAALALFGTPLEDLSTAEIPDFLKSLQNGTEGIGDFTGATEEMGDKLNSGPAKDWERITRLWDQATATVADKLLPVVSTLTEWMAGNPELLELIVIGLGMLAVALGVASVAVWAMNAALFASPITWIILAVGLLVAAIVWLVMNWDTAVAFVGDVWNNFLMWVFQVSNGIADWWNGLWSGISQFFISTWMNIVAFFIFKWAEFQGVLSGVGSFFQSVFGGIGSFISNAFNNAVSVVRGAINGIIGLVNGAIGALNRLSVKIPDGVPVVGGMTFGINLPKIPYLARGGPVEAGRPYVVGDSGYPELFVPETDGFVHPRVPTMTAMTTDEISASLEDVDVTVGAREGSGPTVIKLVTPDGRELMEWVLESSEDEEARL